MKRKPSKKPPQIITPTATASASNQNYYASVIDSDSDTEPGPRANNNNREPVTPNISDEAYLPEQHNFEINSNEEDSLTDSSMGSSSTETKGPILTAEGLLKLMTATDITCTGTPVKDFKYTDVVNF